MITEKVYSPIEDKNIHTNLNNSPIWKECHKEEEVGDVRKPLWIYWIKFDGTTPIQVTKIQSPTQTRQRNDKKRKRNTGRY
jgi:hypothetical protein